MVLCNKLSSNIHFKKLDIMKKYFILNQVFKKDYELNILRMLFLKTELSLEDLEPVIRMKLNRSFFRKDDRRSGLVLVRKVPLELRVWTLPTMTSRTLRTIDAKRSAIQKQVNESNRIILSKSNVCMLRKMKLKTGWIF